MVSSRRPGHHPDVADRLTQQIELFERYLADERRMSRRTVETYGRDLRALRDFAAEEGLPLDAKRLGVIALRGHLAKLFETNGSATLARKLSAFRSFYRFLTRRGIVKENPASALKTPKVRKPLPKFLTVEDSFRVVEAPSSDEGRDPRLMIRDRAILELLYGGGLRVSEVEGLTLERLDVAERRVRVVGKGDKERVIPLGAAAARALEAWLETRPRMRAKKEGAAQHPTALFLGRMGTALSARQIQNVVRRYGALGAGRGDLHPHALRHTCATHLLDAGADLRGIQELLGHASLSTTQRYTHVSVDRLMAVYDASHPLARKKKSSDG